MRGQRIRTPVRTGVKVIDLFTPLCAGQRIGIFAGSGIGKSTLLGMLAARRASTPPSSPSSASAAARCASSWRMRWGRIGCAP
jgi:F0F1-type ATP synthase beta subunit